MDSFIDLPMSFDDVEEKIVGPKGLYDLVITDVKAPAEGKTSYLAIIEITKAPAGVKVEDLKNILHNISLPSAENDKQKNDNIMLFLKRFAYAFKVELKGNQFNPMAFIGKKVVNQECDVKVYQNVKSNVLVLKEVPRKK